MEGVKELPPTIWWRCGDGIREGVTRGSRRSTTSWEHWKRSMGGMVMLKKGGWLVTWRARRRRGRRVGRMFVAVRGGVGNEGKDSGMSGIDAT